MDLTIYFTGFVFHNSFWYIRSSSFISSFILILFPSLDTVLKKGCLYMWWWRAYILGSRVFKNVLYSEWVHKSPMGTHVGVIRNKTIQLRKTYRDVLQGTSALSFHYPTAGRSRGGIAGLHTHGPVSRRGDPKELYLFTGRMEENEEHLVDITVGFPDKEMERSFWFSAELTQTCWTGFLGSCWKKWENEPPEPFGCLSPQYCLH